MAEMITAAQAAQILGVTDARVRQLTGDGRITGHVHGPGVVLYDQVAIELYRRVTGGADVTSGVAVTATDAATPLRLEVDEVLPLDFRSALGSSVHARIWRSTQRTVVVISGVAANTISVDGWHFRECILPAVSDAYLGGDYLSPIWITVRPREYELDIVNQVVVVREPEPTSSTTGGRALMNLRGEPKQAPTRIIVSSNNITAGLKTIDRLTGHTVRHFPDSDLATPDNVRALSAGREQPVSVVVDQPGLRATATAMQAISAQSVTDPVTARIALRALAHRIDSIAGVPIPTRQPNWMTDIAEGGKRRRDGFDAQHCAVDARVDTIEDIDWRAIAEPTRPTAEELAMAWSGLGAWLDTVAPYAPAATRDAEMASALDYAMREIRRDHEVRQFQSEGIAPLTAYPTTYVHYFQASAVTNEFWNQCAEGADESTELRRLMHDRRLETFLGEEVRVRTTREGQPVARYEEGENRHDILITWPRLTPDYPRIPEGSSIVATCYPDPAVFIRKPDGELNPLPRPADMPDNMGWGWGYPGSGPAALAAAICEVLAVSDNLDFKPNDRLIDDMLTRSPEDRLDISIDSLRAVIHGGRIE